VGDFEPVGEFLGWDNRGTRARQGIDLTIMASSLTEVSIDALDTRLRRLEYAITGNVSSTKEASLKTSLEGGNIPSQIAALNERLARLASQSKHLKRLLQACPCPHFYPLFPVPLPTALYMTKH